MKWYALTAEQCFKKLKTSHNGLSPKEANKRLATYGQNSLELRDTDSAFKRWWQQFNNFLIYILLLAALITFYLDH